MKLSRALSLFLVFFLAACSPKNAPQPLSDIATSPENYPAAKQISSGTTQNDGFIGLVKIFVQHGIEDAKGVVGTYIAQATGNVIVRNGQWYVITARHVIVPNANLKEMILDPNDTKKKLEFAEIRKTGTKISLGYTDVQPSKISLPTNQDLDVAILQIPMELTQSLIYQPFDAKFDSSQSNQVQLGFDVECWGYPAKQYPQTKKLSISVVNKNIFVLNEALEPGFSGGPIVAPSSEDGRLILGMILRADNDSKQSIALSWSSVETIFQDSINGSSSTISIGKNETVKYGTVDFTYYDSYDFPFVTSSSKAWWQFWK